MNTHTGSDYEGGNLQNVGDNSKTTIADNKEIKDNLPNPVIDSESNIQVKFSINDSANGKGKCTAEDALPSFSGLSKEELLKYANDPFWVRMRFCLFIFFWIIWIMMFVGAIGIIVLAPKCEPPKKQEWYEQGPLYEVEIAKFVPAKENESLLQQMISKLDYLSKIKIKGIILSPIFKTDGENEENVVNFKEIDEKFGTMKDFQDFISKSKEKQMNVILSFVPNHSSFKHSWFNKSVTGEKSFRDFYVWAPASGTNPDGSKKPPNNWLSTKGGSAWEWVETRQEFYLHQFDKNQPDLNYHNPVVLNNMKEVLSHWIGLGVRGFNLDKTQYLLEDAALADEVPGLKPGAVHTEYEFYSHKKTHNLPGVADILSSWRQLIKEETEKQGVLIVTGNVPVPTDSNSTTITFDIKRSDKLLRHLKKGFTAKDLYPYLQEIIESSENLSSVQLGDRTIGRVGQLLGEESVDGLNMITLFLPATPITYFGEELGLTNDISFIWGNETNGVIAQQEASESHYKVYKALVESRDTQTLLYGNSTLKVLNDSVLVFTRIKLGNPGYLVAYNPSPQNITADLSNIDFVPSDIMFYTKSVNFPLQFSFAKDKVKSKNVFLAPYSAAVFTFAPKTDN